MDSRPLRKRGFVRFWGYCLWTLSLLIVPAREPLLAEGPLRPLICIASYNVENFFDIEHDHSEYPGYIPYGPQGWDREMMEKKRANLLRVITDIDADILALQEVENRQALLILNRGLRAPYPYTAIAGGEAGAVCCALLSRLPVAESREIAVPGGGGRAILEVRIDVRGSDLFVFVNHWKAKSAPESRRIISARLLSERLLEFPREADIVVAGDFNSNYNEYLSLSRHPDLNDTGGRTGINHVLGTMEAGELVAQEDMRDHEGDKVLLYDPWQEIEKHRRWSAAYKGAPKSPDHLLLSRGLFDEEGLSYVSDSFDRFDPGYLFEGRRIFRWQRSERGRGRHLGRGYSDHLPIYLLLSAAPFSESRQIFD